MFDVFILEKTTSRNITQQHDNDPIRALSHPTRCSKRRENILIWSHMNIKGRRHETIIWS